MKNQQTLRKIFSYMEEYHMIEPGDEVVAGVSGGADSVCLLFALYEFSKMAPFHISVVHVNHLIRKEASLDADYVRRLCEELELPFYLYEEDVEKLAKSEGISTEEAGRSVRYNAFFEVADRLKENSGKIPKIAVAHNKNDCAETVLFHLFRGSGIKGLTGILPVRDSIIRPLLCLERWEIEEYLHTLGRDYCMDKSNEEDEYTRNRIRHHILPYAEKEIVKGAVGHVCNSAGLLAEAEDYLELQTLASIDQYVRFASDTEVCIEATEFVKLHTFLQKRVLFEVLCKLSPGRKDISSVHVELLQKLFSAEVGSCLNLPFGILGRKEYTSVTLCLTKQEVGKCEEVVSIPVNPNSFSCDYLGNHFCFEVFFADSDTKMEQIPENQYTKWFDYDKINGLLVLRTRQSKDRLSLRRAEDKIGHKSLKDYMITEKIPSRSRDFIPVLAVEHEVLWLVGYRIGESYKIDENTKRILQVKWIKNNTREERG